MAKFLKGIAVRGLGRSCKAVTVIVSVFLLLQGCQRHVYGSAHRGVLYHLGICLRAYAEEHGGAFPSRFAALTNYIDGVEFFRCPFVKDAYGDLPHVDEWTDYRILPNRTLSDPHSTVLVYCDSPEHGNVGVCVLFVDGNVEWYDRATFAAMVKVDNPNSTNRLRSAPTARQ